MSNQNNINQFHLFSSPVFMVEKPDFLKVTRKIAKKFIDKRKKEVELDHNFPVYMTENMNADPHMLEFSEFVAQSAWKILESQGYAMQFFNTYFTEMWAQEHHKGSSMDRHIHGNGALISGFYFLNCPDNAKVIFHDVRDAKVITSLPEQDATQITHASNMVNFPVTNGLLVFSNSWLPHSFTKNTENIPLTFIHFNIAVSAIQQQNVCQTPQVEII